MNIYMYIYVFYIHIFILYICMCVLLLSVFKNTKKLNTVWLTNVCRHKYHKSILVPNMYVTSHYITCY